MLTNLSRHKSVKMRSSLKKNPLVYYFMPGSKVDGHLKMNDTLGGKGAYLAEMSRLGIPIPPGFTIPSEMCIQFFANGKQELSGELKTEIEKAVHDLGRVMGEGRAFGSQKNPLLVSVRSGARVSMPGMMDSILNLGLNDELVLSLAEKSGNETFAWDCYRRFIQMYAEVVLSIDSSLLVFFVEDLKRLKNYSSDQELTEKDLKQLVKCFKDRILEMKGRHFPQDPMEQLFSAIKAVFRSWNNPRAKAYRSLNHLPDTWGTAINVQAMVFGNKGQHCATGVAFTRDPSSGHKMLVGEYLINAQGEDIVAGHFTPLPIHAEKTDSPSLKKKFSHAYDTLIQLSRKLETHFKEPQDIEFTVEEEQLWILQTRSLKRTAKATVKIALDMLDEGLISKEETLLKVKPSELEGLLHPCLSPEAKKQKIGKGLPASPGGVNGKVMLSVDEALKAHSKGEKVILARVETSADDIQGVAAAVGVITSRGGFTSHAAVVARGMGKCCIVGLKEMVIDLKNQSLKIGSHSIEQGDVISMDGATGEVFLGEVETIKPKMDQSFERFMSLMDGTSGMEVRVNADTAEEAKLARQFGASGIGLCRTEHMFFKEERVVLMRKMILAGSDQERAEALLELLDLQKSDFIALFQAMEGLPVTIRLLDPPLHEFLPQNEQEIKAFSEKAGLGEKDVAHKVDFLSETNPMLGHRGIRLCVSSPEITQTQVRAIAGAMVHLLKEGHRAPEADILVPFVSLESELRLVTRLIHTTMKSVQEEEQMSLPYKVSTMIELPRACLVAGDLARHVKGLSFGTNDLSQTVLGISRDDSSRFLPAYLSKNLLKEDPFVALDLEGVGELIKTAVERARKTRPGISIGACGEQVTESGSLRFLYSLGMDYVSCSAYRVPLARLAVAHCALKNQKEKK